MVKFAHWTSWRARILHKVVGQAVLVLTVVHRVLTLAAWDLSLYTVVLEAQHRPGVPRVAGRLIHMTARVQRMAAMAPELPTPMPIPEHGHLRLTVLEHGIPARKQH